MLGLHRKGRIEGGEGEQADWGLGLALATGSCVCVCNLMASLSRGTGRPQQRRGRGGSSAPATGDSSTTRDLDSGQCTSLALSHLADPRGGTGPLETDSMIAAESDEVRQLRSKYQSKLATAKELFPDWTDEDVLYAIHDANGDVEVAIVRMSEGKAALSLSTARVGLAPTLARATSCSPPPDAEG